ncbi:MAG: hypothetical protein FJY98_02060 [Candidatus Liptonbacteria bacterium]|nr:hypothetical protein [Candidatus Liptonbacteria bacterium]
MQRPRIERVCVQVPVAKKSMNTFHFPDHRVLRTATKRRMFKNVANNGKSATLESYRGLLKHGNTRTLQTKLH